MAKTPSIPVDEVLGKYIADKRTRGSYTESALDRYVPKPEVPTEPVIVNGVASVAPQGSIKYDTEFDRMAMPVLTSWLKGKGGLDRVSKNNLWDTDTVGGVTANEYYRRAKKFDNPNLPTPQRITQMIYGVETSGKPEAWKTVNSAGFMGRAQMGRDFMKDYGIDPGRYMSDPTYQDSVTVDAVGKRIKELNGKYFEYGGMATKPSEGKISGPSARLYPEGDHTEDLLIVNPVDGSLYGALRYDELIFSQRDSKTIDALVKKGDTASLGKFVAKARAKHDDFATMFAGGNKLTKIDNGYLVDDYQNIYQRINGQLFRVGRIDEGKVKLMAEQPVDPKDFEEDSSSPAAKRKKSALDEILAGPKSLIDAIMPKTSAQNPVTETAKTTPKSTPAATQGRTGSGKTTPAAAAGSPSAPGEDSNRVKVVQEYLNGFLSAKTLEQQGYSRGENGELYAPDGKRVPIDKIKAGALNEQIAEDGKFGPETESAIRLYNTLNPTKQINYRDIDGSKYLDDTDNLDFMQGYIETGKVPRYDRSKVKAKELLGKTKPAEIGIKDALPVIPKGAVKPGETPAPTGKVSGGITAQNLNRLGGNAVDLLKMGAAFSQANQPLPVYEQTADWKNYTDTLRNQAGEGLNAAVQSQFNQDMNRNRALGYAQITSASGGGGTQGAVLGALGQVNQASANAIGQFAVADQAQRTQNLARFGSVAAANENTNLGMYDRNYQQTLMSNQQAASVIPQLAANIEDRNNYYNAYGSPDSPYQKFLKGQIDRQAAEVDYMKRISADPRAIYPSGLTPPAPGGLSINDKTLLEQTRKRISG